MKERLRERLGEQAGGELCKTELCKLCKRREEEERRRTKRKERVGNSKN